MKEALIRSVLKRVGMRPLERLTWAVDFSRRSVETPGDVSNAELELTCFMYAPNLQHFPNLVGQIQALMTTTASKHMPYRGSEVARVQQRFTEVLMASAGNGETQLPLKYLKLKFTRADGIEYVSTILGQSRQSAEQTEAKIEAVVYKLLRLLDETVRTGLNKARGGERFIPLRMYVGICPVKKDGCGNLFAKSRIDQDYCSRTCVSRAQVRRFRRTQNKN